MPPANLPAAFLFTGYKMVILGLGSNLGDRHSNLNAAITHISALLLDNIKHSHIYETAPLLPPNPGPDWHKRKFLNMAVSGSLKQELSPEQLLAQIKELETKLGRIPADRWAPRIIDIDILAIDGLVYNSANLKIPHIGLLERDFAMLPFADIAPEWKHPVTGITAKEYAKQHNLNPICN
mgnify:CR=1 FL=1